MNFTKSILLTVIYSAGLLAPAIAVADADPATFQAEKDQHIAKILERIQIDQKDLSCVQAAQDHAALEACNLIVKPDHEVLEPKADAPVPAIVKKTKKGTTSKEKKRLLQ